MPITTTKTMSTILRTPVKTNHTLAITTKQANAISDVARAKIVEILYRRSLTVDEIVKELEGAGIDKSTATIRHHIRVLREAKMIDVTQIDEVRGTVIKQYGTKIRLLNYDVDETFEEDYQKLIHNTTSRINKTLGNILSQIRNPKENQQPDPYYDYLTMAILNRAITNVLESSNSNS